MSKLRRVSFEGTLVSIRGGGPLRSNLVEMGGAPWLGVHKETVQTAGVSVCAPVRVEIAADNAPLTASVS